MKSSMQGSTKITCIQILVLETYFKRVFTSTEVLLTYYFFNKVLAVVTFYQQPGDTKKPYFAQYSNVVCEDAPVKASYATTKNNIPINNILNPPKIYFNAFLIEVFLAIADNIIITED